MDSFQFYYFITLICTLLLSQDSIPIETNYLRNTCESPRHTCLTPPLLIALTMNAFNNIQRLSLCDSNRLPMLCRKETFQLIKDNRGLNSWFVRKGDVQRSIVGKVRMRTCYSRMDFGRNYCLTDSKRHALNVVQYWTQLTDGSMTQITKFRFL